MSRFIFVKNVIAGLMLASAATVCAQSRPTPLYSTTFPVDDSQPFAITTTVPAAGNPRAQYVALATSSSSFRCLPVCNIVPAVEVSAWKDTTTSLVQTSASSAAALSASLAAVAITGLDSGRVVTADVDGNGVLSIQTWTVGASGAALQNGYSTAASSASPKVAIATLSSTEVVTAYSLPSGTLAVEAWTISAAGVPTPVSTVGYQSGDVTGNQVLPGQSDVFANQVSIATVNPNQVITAIGDSSQSLWVTTWGVNNAVQAQQLQQLPNLVASYGVSVAVGAGQTSVLVPGIGLRPPHYETVQNAFTPVSNSADEWNVLSWTISTTGQLTEQPAPTASCCGTNELAATMLPTNIPITSYTFGASGDQMEEFYHGALVETQVDGWGVELSRGYSDPPAIYPINYWLGGPIGSALEGNETPSALAPYNAYFVTASGDPYTNTLYLWVFSYPLPPTTAIL